MQPGDNFQEITNMLEVDTAIDEPDTGMLERNMVIDEPNSGMFERDADGRPDTGVLERDTGVMQRIDFTGERMDLASEIEAIHNGYQHEIQQYQMHLTELMDERNQLLEAYQTLEQSHQELYDNFLISVEEEAQKMVTEAARTITLSPNGEGTSPLLRDAVQTLEVHARQLEDEHTAHTLYLMREAQRKAARLEEQLRIERQQIAAERQNLINLQSSVREQAQLRYRTIQSRLQARSKLQLVVTTGILLVVLLLGQLLFLSLLRVHMSEAAYPLALRASAALSYCRLRLCLPAQANAVYLSWRTTQNKSKGSAPKSLSRG